MSWLKLSDLHLSCGLSTLSIGSRLSALAALCVGSRLSLLCVSALRLSALSLGPQLCLSTLGFVSRLSTLHLGSRLSTLHLGSRRSRLCISAPQLAAHGFASRLKPSDLCLGFACPRGFVSRLFGSRLCIVAKALGFASRLSTLCLWSLRSRLCISAPQLSALCARLCISAFGFVSRLSAWCLGFVSRLSAWCLGSRLGISALGLVSRLSAWHLGFPPLHLGSASQLGCLGSAASRLDFDKIDLG